MPSEILLEIERKFYTFAIGCLAMAALVVLEGHFLPSFSAPTLHTLLRVFRKPWVLVEAEIIAYEALAVLICLPLLKATRVRLGLIDALILSAPVTWVHSLAFCEGFDARYLLSILVMPLLFLGVFRLFALRSIPSLVDDLRTTQAPVIRVLLAAAVAFQFAGLVLFLSGATTPLRIKVVYVAFSLGTALPLAAILRPNLYLLLLAAAVTAFNIDVLCESWPAMKPYLAKFGCH